MRRRIVSAFASAALVTAAMAALAPAASAQEVWSKDLSCGTNFRCTTSSNTTAGASHNIDSVLKASWATGGAHSWSGAISAGAHRATLGTGGSFTSVSASCYCPGGTSGCAV